LYGVDPSTGNATYSINDLDRLVADENLSPIVDGATRWREEVRVIFMPIQESQEDILDKLAHDAATSLVSETVVAPLRNAADSVILEAPESVQRLLQMFKEQP
jgi:hypothetical protein